MSYTQEQENYFKLITLIYCFGTNVNRDLFHRFLHATNTTLEQLINDHQHEIYHFFCNVECCQCKTKPIAPKPKFSKFINPEQMLIIFENSHTDRLDNHQSERTRQLCCLKANKSVELKDLDFTLIRFFLVNFCYQEFWDFHLKNDKSFSAFLEENVHKVYHLSVDKICCCKCNVDRDIPDRCIKKNQFEIICKQGSSACPHPFCSCQYTVQSDLTLASLIQQDKDLTSKLTKHFCSCRQFLEKIYDNRNKIAHDPDCGMNNDNFWTIWNETKLNILEVAKALDKENEYKVDLQELIDGPTDKVLFITIVLNLLKTSEHVTVNTLQKIKGKENSFEDKIEAVCTLVKDIQIAKFNNMNSSECSGNDNVNSDLEFSFEVKLQINSTSKQTAQGSGVENSEIDEPPDNFTCGKCKESFTKLKMFCKHKETCDTKQVNSAKHYSEIIGKFMISQASARLEKNATKMFLDNPDLFDTDEIDVRYVERGCLVVWTESPQYDMENEDKLKEDCIQFTKNMFQKCSLDSTETTSIKVNVNFSKTFQDSLETQDDDSDYLQCGTCRKEFFAINSFISHKKECIRNRKICKQNQEDTSKLHQSSKEHPKIISRTESDSTSRYTSSQILEINMDGDKEYTNYIKLQWMIKTYGCEAVRHHFDSVLPQKNLKRILFENQHILQKEIKEKPYQTLFLHTGIPDSKNFDMQLMTDLLRHLPLDESITNTKEKDIDTIKNKRNYIDHPNDLTFMNNEYEEIWTEVSNAILNLGGPGLKEKCDILKVSNQNILLEITEADEDLVNTITDYQHLQNELERIANKVNVSHPESHNICSDKCLFDQLSPKEKMFLTRLHKLIWRVAPWAVRVKFDNIFPTDTFLRNVSLYINEGLNCDETVRTRWKEFEGRENLTSAGLDFQFLTSVLTSVCATDNILSTSIDSCEQEALQTLVHHRDFIKYNEYERMSTETMDQYCLETSKAIISLGGQQFDEICDHVLSAEIYQIEKYIILGILKIQQHTQIQKTQHQDLKSNIQKSLEEIVSSPILKQKRHEIELEIDKWKKESDKQVTLESVQTLTTYLNNNCCVVVTGGVAAGKTSIIRSVALQMQTLGYQIIPVRIPEDIVRFYKNGEEMLFVIDDFCGKSIVNEQLISRWKTCADQLEMLTKETNFKILLSSKSYLYKDSRVASLSLLQCEFSGEFNISISEQEYVKLAERVSLDTIVLSENTDLQIIFPSLIQRLKESNIKTISSSDLTTSAYEIYKSELEIFFVKDKQKYCALALLVIFDNHLLESYLTNDDDGEIKIKIEKTYKACNVNIDVPKQSLLNELEVLVDSFTVSFYDNFDKVFSAKNKTVFDILAKYIGTKIQSCLIECGDASFLSQRAAFRCSVTNEMFSPLTLIIEEKHKDIYLKRMIRDLNNDYVSDVFVNINLGSPAFRDIFFEIIKRKSKTEQMTIMNKMDVFNKTTPLIQSCFLGDIHVIDWILSLDVDVNLCRDDGTSPLYVACQEGHKDIACRLLEYGANLNLCTNAGVTPLDIANEQGHKEISNVLVAFKTDKVLMFLFILFHLIFLLYISAF